MTDYLEELLDEVRQEQEGGTMLWRRVNRISAGIPMEEKDAAGGTVQTAGTVAAGFVRSWQWQEMQNGMVWELNMELERLRRGVLRAQRQGVERRVRLQAEAVTQPGGGWFRMGTAAGLGYADHAARVDVVFQRDARRYDGPLRLL